jgi:hypothetical protein
VGEGGSLWNCPVGAQSLFVLPARGGQLADGAVCCCRIQQQQTPDFKQGAETSAGFLFFQHPIGRRQFGVQTIPKKTPQRRAMVIYKISL